MVCGGVMVGDRSRSDIRACSRDRFARLAATATRPANLNASSIFVPTGKASGCKLRDMNARQPCTHTGSRRSHVISAARGKNTRL